MSSLLHQLPLELFHMIFGYLWAHEILQSFGDISEYLNDLLSNYQNYLVNCESIRKSHFDLVCHLRPEQVISLILSDKTETPNQSQIFRSIFSIVQFTRLRALKLIELDDDGESFISDLYKVPNLVSLEINIRYKLPFITTTTPSLQRFIINIQRGVQFDLDSSIVMFPFEQLRELSLSSCSTTQLKHIFRRAVQLASLTISFTILDPGEIVGLANFHQGQSRTPVLSYLSLSIDVHCDPIKRVDIERFLAPLQCLRELELVILCGAKPQFLDANQWEIFITKHLPRLLTFNFKFFAWNMNENLFEQFRRPFWLDKQWFVAYNEGHSFLYTVPYFAYTSTDSSYGPILFNWTTLPIEQHTVFYDRISQLTVDSDEWKSTGRYNHVKKLFLDGSCIRKNALNLSTVQKLVVKSQEWSFDMVVTLIKEAMPSVNHLTLACPYPDESDQHLSNISLEQVRILCLPDYGDFLDDDDDAFNWSQFFPRVEQLTVCVNSKSQIPALIDHFENMTSGYFYIDPCHIHFNKPVHMTRQWLTKRTYRLRGKNANNFVCQINAKYFMFSVCLWIGEGAELDKEEHTVRDDQWWRQCLPRKSVQ